MAAFVLSMFLFSCHHSEADATVNVGNDSIVPKDTLLIPAPTPTLITHP